MKDNVLTFPVERTRPPASEMPPDTWHDDISCGLLATVIDSMINDHELNFDNIELVYETSLVDEAVNSLVMATQQEMHPLQEFSRELYTKHLVTDISEKQLCFDF